MRRAIAPLLCGLALLATGGCRNPFEPSSDIELTHIESANGSFGQGATLMVHSSDASAVPLVLDRWTVRFRVVIRNKVSVYLRSAAITYTDLDGNEVTSYRNIGGRNLKFTVLCRSVTDNAEFGDGDNEAEGRATTFSLFVVDSPVITAIKSSSYPATKVMIASIVLRGEDENGYDVRLEGQIAIQYLD